MAGILLRDTESEILIIGGIVIGRSFLLAVLGLCLLSYGCASPHKGPKLASYLDWEPVLKPEEVFKSAIGFTYVKTDRANNAFWVEQRPDEEGRSVLVQLDNSGKIRDLTPKNYSVRTRVFEYGSYPYAVHGGWVYFTNFTDQRIYKQSLDNPSVITPITPEANADGGLGKYAELTVSPDGRWLVFAYEKEPKTGEHPNYIGLIDLKNESVQEAKVIAKGADFYKMPKFSPDGSTLAWLEWNHPYMSWDSTRLYMAPFKEGNLGFKSKTKIAGSNHSSVSEFSFSDTGEIFYAVDFAGWSDDSPRNYYNIHGFKAGRDRILTKSLRDYQVIEAVGSKLACVRYEKGQGSAVILDPESGDERVVAAGYAAVGLPQSSLNGNLYFAASPEDRPGEMLEVLPSGEIHVLRKSAAFQVQNEDVSRGELVKFPTQDGKFSYGYFYPPVNSHYLAPAGEKPPVRVLVHGGPISMTSKAFGLSKMYWTSQGYAIFDVNYRGSVGFGRQYRDALKHKWGILEIQDVKDGLAYLTQNGRISGQAVVSGGSAGGYTVQRLLTFYPDLFAAGASHFGIGNLVTLQKLTHKFESHFLEQLIGGTLKTNFKEYNDRSPINHLDKLKAPMIIFQGSDDKVVPPENSREMAEILKKKGVEYEYYEYPGEGHGFRKRENLVATVDKESRFFKRILKRSQPK